jgi:hypothetical protein
MMSSGFSIDFSIDLVKEKGEDVPNRLIAGSEWLAVEMALRMAVKTM